MRRVSIFGLRMTASPRGEETPGNSRSAQVSASMVVNAPTVGADTNAPAGDNGDKKAEKARLKLARQQEAARRKREKQAAPRDARKLIIGLLLVLAVLLLGGAVFCLTKSQFTGFAGCGAVAIISGGGACMFMR